MNWIDLNQRSISPMHLWVVLNRQPINRLEMSKHCHFKISTINVSSDVFPDRINFWCLRWHLIKKHTQRLATLFFIAINWQIIIITLFLFLVRRSFSKSTYESDSSSVSLVDSSDRPAKRTFFVFRKRDVDLFTKKI